MANGEGYYTQQPDMDTVQDIIRKKNLLQGLLPGLQLGTPPIYPGEPQPATTDDQGQPLYYPDAPVPVGAPPSPTVAAPTPAKAPEIAGLADMPELRQYQASYKPQSGVTQQKVGEPLTPETQQAQTPPAEVAPQPSAAQPTQPQPSGVDPAIQSLLDRLEDEDKQIRALGGQLPQPPSKKQRILGSIAAAMMAGPGRQPALGVELGQQAIWGPYERQLQRYGLQKQDLQSQYERTLKTFEGVERAKSEEATAAKARWEVTHPKPSAGLAGLIQRDIDTEETRLGRTLTPEERAKIEQDTADRWHPRPKPATGLLGLINENTAKWKEDHGGREPNYDEQKQIEAESARTWREHDPNTLAQLAIQAVDTAREQAKLDGKPFTQEDVNKITQGVMSSTESETKKDLEKSQAQLNRSRASVQQQLADAATKRAEAAAAEAGQGGRALRDFKNKSLTVMNKAAEDYRKTVESADTAINSLESSTPVGDILAIPEALRTFLAGQSSGFRMTQAEINQVLGGQTKAEEFWTHFNKWLGDPNYSRFPPGFKNDILKLLKAKKAKDLKMRNHTVNAIKDLSEATDIGTANKAYASYANGPPEETPKQGPTKTEIGPDGKLRIVK